MNTVAWRRRGGSKATDPVRRCDLEPDVDAPRMARSVVAEFCATYGIGQEREVAELIASELVTNAVRHAGTPITLTLRLTGPLLRVSVRDGSNGQVQPVQLTDETAESGRGLSLVDALAFRWGTVFLHSGKTVWATVRVRPSVG
jgi:anti-sigma regulatory factor (Ser/Thr protein kinase)